jgi:DNA-directed RNA polymerase subunit RPC12/RpoP
MPANLLTCADCSTQYACDLKACPHCGSSDFVSEEGAVTKRLPLFVTLSCSGCGNGPWTVRLNSVTSGLIELPTLGCVSCGSRVPVTWPPLEESMSPKITTHGGATNAREAGVSPAAVASEPQVAAEGDLGHPTSEELDTVQNDTLPEVDDVQDETVPDYDSMTLAELREAAGGRELPTYGTKAQLIERLRDADSA